jgi:hypothetical protein
VNQMLDACADDAASTRGYSGPWFDGYTEAQLAVIQSAVRRAAATTHPVIVGRRPDGLNGKDHERLLQFASSYKISRVDRTPTSTTTPKTEKNLRRISLLCGELRRTINSSRWADSPRDRLTNFIDLLGQLAEKTAAVERNLNLELHAWLGGRVPKSLVTPRGSYYNSILCLWIEIGGDLKFSRQRKSKVLQGPLIEFLEAATNPVLGVEALKNTSLQSVIELTRRVLDRAATRHYRLAERH